MEPGLSSVPPQGFHSDCLTHSKRAYNTKKGLVIQGIVLWESDAGGIMYVQSILQIRINDVDAYYGGQAQ